MEIRIIPLTGIPAVRPGDDLGAILGDAVERSGGGLQANDVVVVCQKVVSKSEGRIVRVDEVHPRARAAEYAREFDKDPVVVELALQEAREVLRMERGHLITATGPGWICANSGLDRSNQKLLSRKMLAGTIPLTGRVWYASLFAIFWVPQVVYPPKPPDRRGPDRDQDRCLS